MKVLVILFIVVALSKQQSQCDSSDVSSDRSSDSRDSHEHHHHHQNRPKSSPPKCPTGWLMFERISGKWCVQVFEGIFNRNEAQAKCQRIGATLSGMENAHEKHLIHKKGMEILKKQNIAYSAMWLGLIRKKDCRGEANRNKEACQRSRAYYWNDGSTHSTDMIIWNRWYSDNRGVDQDCAYMLVSASGKPHPNGAHPGNFHDIPCDSSKTQNNNFFEYTRAYACGMKPR
ncbi:unnamed protein product [Caenorhabditis angaria]|uniref:C-type lectin domain-containing protein n=1 Tax=Caenorhabditis angaria TaxID=860376 RepID=A0A9P1IKW1_9PELO|nr:unnamed protein product [Caenorhabditis angaria]